MKFLNQRNQSGFELKLEPAYWDLQNTQDKRTKRVDVHTYRLYPKKADEGEIFEVDMNILLRELRAASLGIRKNEIDLNDAIFNLANKWGHIQSQLPNFINLNNYKKQLDMVVMSHLIHANSRFFDDLEEELSYTWKEVYSEHEYNAWKNLLEIIIPVTEPEGKQFLKINKKRERYLEVLNQIVSEGAIVKFKSIHRKSYDVIPTNLNTAITLFAQKKRNIQKVDISSSCAYKPCGKEITIDLGPGRQRKYCSDSCRVLKGKYGENGPKNKGKVKLVRCAYKPCGKKFEVRLGSGRQRLTCSHSCRTLLSRSKTK